jgi:hypothetical protein
MRTRTFKLTCATKGLDAISAASVLGVKLSALLGALTRSLAHSENEPFLPAPSNRTDEPLQ